MTPFAVEISSSISRFVTHKASIEALSNSEQLTKKLFEYMQYLYPAAVMDEKEHFLCFSKLHHKHSQKKSTDSIEEWIEYVPIFIENDYHALEKSEMLIFQNEKIALSSRLFEDADTTYSLHLDYQKSKLYLKKEDKNDARVREADEAFTKKMEVLKEKLQTHPDIKNGFVIFVSNNSYYWDKEVSVGYQSLLRGCHCDKLTIIPDPYKSANGESPCCQIVWKKTRYDDVRCCIGTYDNFFHSHEFPCSIELQKKSVSFTSEYKALMPQGGQKKALHKTLSSKFYSMLRPERFIPSSKKTFGDWENDFMNDYSRLMMSPAVRRMKDKTQVFTMDDSDFVRTRLTHSLEVANIAKLIGLGVEYELSQKKLFGKLLFPNIYELHIPQILEVVGLIHDIGNPPYGHFGEKTIQNYFRHPELMPKSVRRMFDSLTPQQKADFQNFDGNVQGFRILCHLGLSSDCTSFNLNKVILSSMIKYPYNSIDGNKSQEKDHRKSKFGYFFAEEQSYENICSALNLEQGQRHPLAYILEAADDITYIGDDIEDGWKLAYITTQEIVNQIEKLQTEHIKEIFEGQWSELKNRLLSSNKIIVANAIQSMRIRLQRFMVRKVITVFCDKLPDIIKNDLDNDKQELFNHDETLTAIHDIFWRPLVQKCYDGIHVTQLQGERVLSSLLNLYLEAISDTSLIKWKDLDDGKRKEICLDNMIKSGMLFETISDNYRDDLSPIGQFIPQDAYGKIMLITDHISGMTDTFAYNKYHELCAD